MINMMLIITECCTCLLNLKQLFLEFALWNKFKVKFNMDVFEIDSHLACLDWGTKQLF